LSPAANAHDSPLLAPTLDTLGDHLLAPGEMTVHLDRGYDSGKTRRELEARGMLDCISRRGTTTPVQVSNRWMVERTNSWHNAFKKLVWCTERRTAVVTFSSPSPAQSSSFEG
jgi:IS5 family transposase